MNTLKRTLLTLLLPALILLLCGELWLSYRALLQAANSAYDRSLTGAIKAIDANISTSSGGLGMELPYTMLEFFQLTANGRVFYRITTEDGLVTLGNADLPKPQIALQSNVPHFYDARYFGDAVRVGAYARFLTRPLYGVQPQRVIIQVAETIESRTSFTWNLLKQAALLDALLVLLIALMMTGAVVIALRPLQRLRYEVMARDQDDLTPIDAGPMPLEVRPLVDAINHHIERSRELARDQRQFLDDASHQLRTPLAVLRTQVDYALREPDLGQVRAALAAMQDGVDRAARLVNQLLALARANNTDALVEPAERIDLIALCEGIGRTLFPEARRKSQDFGFVACAERVFINGNEALLREAIINLVDNAIRHVQKAGQLTLEILVQDGSAVVVITDNGPGMSADDRSRVGERFRRGKNAHSGGAGLGMSIAKAIVERHGGSLEVGEGLDRRGLSIRLIFPLPVESVLPLS